MDADRRVVRLPPRTSDQLPHILGNAAPLAEDALDQAAETPDDYTHRMLINLAAFGFVGALTGIGVWLAISIADLRKVQDCALAGRSNCAVLPFNRASAEPNLPPAASDPSPDTTRERVIELVKSH